MSEIKTFPQILNVGIIGYGKMGRLRHKICETFSNVKVIALNDPYEPNIQNTNGVRVYKRATEIISNPDIHVIFIATVNSLNKELTIASLQSGKNVFCEKPPALNVVEMQEVIKAEKQSGKKLMYGFNHRHHGAAVHMHEIVRDQKFGRILWMRGRYGKSVDTDYLDTWRANVDLAGGGILIDQGIHMLDLFLYLGGTFDEVQAMISSVYWEIEGLEDNVFALLRNTETGRVASLHSTMTQWRHLFSLEVFMESGYMVLNGLKTSSNSYGAEKLVIAKNRSKAPAATWEQEDSYEYQVDTSWEREMTVFFNAIKHDAPIVNGNSSDAMQVMKLIDTIYANERHDASERYRGLVTKSP